MSETITHMVIYDAADNHGIVFTPERIEGCSCGFECAEWDDEGDSLVDHLRSLGPRYVQHVSLAAPTQDPTP